MQIAAALLAGGAVFFAGFCLGFFLPVRPKPAASTAAMTSEQSRFFQNFLNYNGDIQP